MNDQSSDRGVNINDIDWNAVSPVEKISYEAIHELTQIYTNKVNVHKELYVSKLSTLFTAVVIVFLGLLFKLTLPTIISIVGVYMFLSTILAAFKEGASKVLLSDSLFLLEATLTFFKKKYPSTKK